MLTIIQTTVLKYWIAARYFFNDFSPLFYIIYIYFFFFFFFHLEIELWVFLSTNGVNMLKVSTSLQKVIASPGGFCSPLMGFTYFVRGLTEVKMENGANRFRLFTSLQDVLGSLVGFIVC